MRPTARPRSPSLWLVLLPAAVLAAVGVRAVLAERDRARDDARDRARVAAERVARAFEQLVQESMDPLPFFDEYVDEAQALDAVRHLSPRWAIAEDGSTRFLSPRDANAGGSDAITQDVLRAVSARLGDGQPHAAAALAAATAESVESIAVAAHLHLMAARLDAQNGDVSSALRQLGRILVASPSDVDPTWSRSATSRAQDGRRVYLDALELATEIVPPYQEEGGTTPEWLLVAHRQALRDPWGLGRARSDGVTARLRDAMGADRDLAASEAARWRSVRDAPRDWARSTSDSRLAVAARGDAPDGRGLVIERFVNLGAPSDHEPVWLGGEIPASLLRSRLSDEMRAAIDDANVSFMQIGDAEDAVLIEHVGDMEASIDLQLFVSVPALSEPTLGRRGVRPNTWIVQAMAREPTGVPPLAILLGLAVGITTLALVGGAVALKRSADRNAQLAEDRRSFLDHVAHEIRTPAAAVLALSEELERGHVMDERQGEYHEHLRRESQRLADLVEETLDLTRLESGRLAVRREPADLVAIVRDAVADARAAASGDVEVETDESTLDVSVDRGAVRRAIRNLVTNALRHGAAGTAPRVTATRDAVNVNVTVADDGPGIDPAQHERIFERFFRVPSETHDVKGVGLGLALCREVARGHGGDVTVESAPGKGATFTLRLPPGDEA